MVPKWIREAEEVIPGVKACELRVSPGQVPPRRFLGKKCPLCGLPYASPEPKPRRWPLAEPIYRAVRSGQIRNLLFIADEAHGAL